MSFSVIVPSRTRTNLLACVSAIRKAGEICRIIVVDDFEDRDEAKYLREAVDTPLYQEGRYTSPSTGRGCTWVEGVKPFVFARNINLGIAAADDDDVILLNDDAILETGQGFSWLAAEAGSRPEFGVMAAAVKGASGCREQLVQAGTRVRTVQHHTVVFIAVYLRREVLNRIQPNAGVMLATQWLDERYEAYGYDDDDMCETIRHDLGLNLGVFDGCVVEHGSLPSTYRAPMASVSGVHVAQSSDLAPNLQRFVDKWGFRPGQRPKAEAAAPQVKW